MSRPNIFEWQRVRFATVYLDYFAVLFLALIGILFARSKRSPYEITVLLIGLIYSFIHNRHIVLFAILAAIYIPKYTDSFIGNRLIKWEERLSPGFLAVVFSCLSLYFIYMAPHRSYGNPLAIKISEREYPLEAIEVIKDNNIEGNIFVNFNWAQLCIRELSPKNKVFFDGRYETVYEKDFIRDYFDVLYGKRDYKDYLKRFPRTDIMLLHRHNPLSLRLLGDKEWIVVHSSFISYLFLKDNEKNRSMIDRFKRHELYLNPSGPSYRLSK